MKILIVDDDPAIRMLYREELEDEGYTVIVASSGEEKTIDSYVFVGLNVRTSTPEAVWMFTNVPGDCDELNVTTTEY